MNLNILVVAGMVLVAAGCATVTDQEIAQRALDVMKASFDER
jgi:hypothetical protein